MNEYWYQKPGDTMTAIEVALFFGVDARSVCRWAKQGKLPHFETPGGRLRFRRPEIEKIAENAEERARKQTREPQNPRNVPR